MRAPSDEPLRPARAQQAKRVKTAAEQISTALRDVLTDAALGAQPSTVDQLEKGIGVSRILAWQVLRLADGGSPVEDLRNLPGKKAYRSFLRAIESVGVVQDKVDRARDAYLEVEQLTAELGGDLANFLEIAFHLNGIQNHTESSAALRNAFRADSRIWGVSARTVYTCWILRAQPGQPGTWELAILSLMIGIRPQSRDEFVVRRHEVHTGKVLGPLAPAESNRDGAIPHLEESFCEGAMPELTLRAGESHHTLHASYDGLGKPAEHTLAFTEASVIQATRADGKGDFAASSRFPCEEIVADLLFERSAPAQVLSRVVCLRAGLAAPTIDRRSGSLALNVPFEVSTIEHPVRGNALEAYPRLAEFVGHALDSLGWNADDFTGERTRAAFPPAQTSLVTEIRLGGD